MAAAGDPGVGHSEGPFPGPPEVAIVREGRAGLGEALRGLAEEARWLGEWLVTGATRTLIAREVGQPYWVVRDRVKRLLDRLRPYPHVREDHVGAMLLGSREKSNAPSA
jgi:hypothetical protein